MGYWGWDPPDEGPERGFTCYDCWRVFAPDEQVEAEEHRDEHWFEYLRSHCPIPPPLVPFALTPEGRAAINAHLNEGEEEVPF
jgi:hypothetical protein